MRKAFISVIFLQGDKRVIVYDINQDNLRIAATLTWGRTSGAQE